MRKIIHSAMAMMRAKRLCPHLTASAGISYNKLLAKIASDWRKPDGMTTIHPDRALDFIAQLRIEKLWGVGHTFFLTCKGVIPKCSLTYLPKNDEFGKPNRSAICVMVRSVCFR